MKMAKDMSKVYAEMLTKELIALRKKHMGEIIYLIPSTKRIDVRRVETLNSLVDQINKELADRVAAFNLFV